MGIELEGCCTLLQVFEMPQSIRFYRNLIGFEVVDWAPPGEEPGWCLLRLGGADLMLNSQFGQDPRPAGPDPERAAYHDDTVPFSGCRDLDAAYRHLQSNGIEVDPPSFSHYGMRQLSPKDPDGYDLCFQWPGG